MADAKEIAAGLGQEAGDDLNMQMRCPTTVFMPIPQRRKVLTNGNLGPFGETGEGGTKVAIKGPKRQTLRSPMFQNHRMAVIQRIGVIGHAMHPSGQRRADHRASGCENVDAQMAAAWLWPGGIAVLIGHINAALFAIKAIAVKRLVGGQIGRALHGEPRIKGPIRKGGHPDAIRGQRQGRRAIGIGAHHRGHRHARKIGANGRRMADRRMAQPIADHSGQKRRVQRLKPLDQRGILGRIKSGADMIIKPVCLILCHRHA